MTDSLKYSLGIFILIIGVYLFTQSSQKAHIVTGSPIFNGNSENVYRVKITDGAQSIELIKSDSTWSILNIDSMVVKSQQIDNLFNRLLKVQQEVLISTSETKQEKFGVYDSLGRHIEVFDENDTELLHYIFGNTGQDYQHNYIRQYDKFEIYRTNDNVFFLLNTTSTYWGDVPPKQTLDVSTTNDN